MLGRTLGRPGKQQRAPRALLSEHVRSRSHAMDWSRLPAASSIPIIGNLLPSIIASEMREQVKRALHATDSCLTKARPPVYSVSGSVAITCSILARNSAGPNGLAK